MIARERTLVKCYHCGEPCAEEHRVHDGKDFCCQGCEVVYDLLRESGLCTYYDLGKEPGTKQGSTIDEQRAELFDLPEVRERVVEFSEEGITRARFSVPQMHCSSCIWLLENLHRVEPAVLRSRVSFAEKELTVTFREPQLPLPRLVQLLRRIGYGPQVTATRTTTGKVLDGTTRLMYIRLGVATFIFGNTMLFSLPEYFGIGSEEGLRSGFQWITMLFSLPVVFFLGTDFLKSAWAGVRSGHVNIDQPIALGILALWARSLWDVLSGTGPGYFDSLAGLLFFLLLGRWYQAHTYRALRFDRTLEDFLPLVVLRRSGPIEAPVKVADLRPGDRIMVRDRELVPVDAVLREGAAHIDSSFITGEPLPVRKQPGDTIKAGGRQRGAIIELEVLRSFADSRLKRVWAEQGSAKDRPAMPRMIDGVARSFTIAVLLLALVTAIYWAGRDSTRIWPVVTAVLIVACPCALALSMPFAYGHAMRILGKRGLFLRDAEVVERMAQVDTVVLDKTGTLTARDLNVVEWQGMPLSDGERSMIRSLARNSTHPLSTALLQSLPGETREAREVVEHPGLGLEGIIGNTPVHIGSAAFCGNGANLPGKGEAQVHVMIGTEHLGHFTIRKRPRARILQAISQLRERFRVALLTGDIQVDAQLAEAFRGATMRTRCSPRDKAEAICAEQAGGHSVLMVGDGLNDAGALAQSDVGITVTETTAALTPASDAIMDADAVATLPHFLRLARRARRIVIASLLISLCYNMVGLWFAASGHLTPLIAAVLMPLSSVTVVAFVTIAVTLATHGNKTDKSHSMG